MAICFRSISYRFISVNQLVTANKHVAQLRLSENGPKRSLFLIEFLGKRTIASVSTYFYPKINERPKDVEHIKSVNKAVATLKPVQFQVKMVDMIDTASNDIILWQNGVGSELITFSNYCRSFPSGIHPYPILSNYEKRMIRMCELYAAEVDSTGNVLNCSSPKLSAVKPDKVVNENERPTIDQIEKIKQTLCRDLPELFVRSMDFRIYHNDLIFENNIRGVTTVGVYHFVKQVAILRTLGHLKFAFVKLDILKVTTHPEDGTVRIRWRIRGVSGLKVFLQFWKIKVWNLKESIKTEESWYDGFSIFYISGEGKIYKHVADKMQPDDNVEEEVQKSAPLAAKLALLLGLVPRQTGSWSDAVLTSDCRDHLGSDCLTKVMLPLDEIE